jgi:hypothetical protein
MGYYPVFIRMDFPWSFRPISLKVLGHFLEGFGVLSWSFLGPSTGKNEKCASTFHRICNIHRYSVLRVEGGPFTPSISFHLPELDTMRVADAQTGRPYSKSLNRLISVEGGRTGGGTPSTRNRFIFFDLWDWWKDGGSFLENSLDGVCRGDGRPVNVSVSAFTYCRVQKKPDYANRFHAGTIFAIYQVKVLV